MAGDDESSNGRAAAIVTEVLAGDPRGSQATRGLVRQLRSRIESWTAVRPAEREGWKAILEAPRKRQSEMAELLARLARQDIAARHYIEKLAPRGPSPELSPISYRNFVIAIEDSPGGTISARLLETPFGERCVVPVDLSFCQGRPAGLVRSVSGQLSGTRDIRRRRATAATPSPERLGVQLFDALFVAGIRDAWMRSKGWLGDRQDRGLRFRLVFDLKRRRSLGVAALPWELMSDPDTGTALVKNVRTPLVRSLEASGVGIEPVPRAKPRILLLRSVPSDQPKLEVGSETWLIEEAWSSVPGVQVESAGADLEELRHLLRSRRFEVLHFMGHGDFDSCSQEGLLVLEDGSGRSLEVSGRTLVEQLAGIPLALVVLSACRSGELPRRDGAAPFAGVAAALVRAGFPAVVAMQYSITDSAAVAFAGGLYRYLAAGATVEAAVTEGRLAISRRDPRSLEWMTPVLYLRDDGPRFPATAG